MCAITGTVNWGKRDALTKMLNALAHRGPDDQGVYVDEDTNIALGHRRLAIIDLSSGGHQPMLSADGSVAVVFNGEIYNYKALTRELQNKGYSFKSQSDTEVLVHGYREYGGDVFKKLDGMWALALYDKARGLLHLSRDPAGIKPLYFYQKGRSFAFASEIGALAAVLPHQLSLNRSALKRFLVHGYVYGNETIYQDIMEVPCASTLTFSLRDVSVKETQDYYPMRGRVSHTLREGIETFTTLFADSVRATLQADVPVGLFLSGGIDSALVGYEAHRAGARLQAFTIGFPERTFDESAVASRIAAHLGFAHQSVVMTGTEVARDIEHILDAFGEPFADMSALPMYYVSKHAREEGCKVALSGDGADELFGGYQTHYLPSITRAYRHTPRALDALLYRASRFLPGEFQKLGHREKLTRFLSAARDPFEAAHAKWKNVFNDCELHYLLTKEAYESLRPEVVDFDAFFADIRGESESPVDSVSKVDFMTFLTADCLVKSDIASMQHGLEVRVPFLNKSLIDFAWFLPADLKVTPFKTKKVLRAALAQRLPREITRLPKRGFVPPLGEWLAGALKPALLDLLSEDMVAKVGFLDYTYVAHLIDEHLDKRADNAKKLWALMSLVRFFSANLITYTIRT